MSELELVTITEQTIQAAVGALEQRTQEIQARLTCLEAYLAEYNALVREKRNIRRLLEKYKMRRMHEETRV